jgi:two-component system, OmpR family, sensor histidine kinase TctE
LALPGTSKLAMKLSLKRTLLAWLLAPMLVIVPAAAALQYWLVLEPMREAFDQVLLNAALSLAGQVGWRGDAVTFDLSAQAERALRTDRTDSVFYAVLGPNGQNIAGDPPLTQEPLTLAAEEWRLYQTQIDGEPVRVASLGVSCGVGVCQVRVGKTQIESRQLSRQSLVGSVLGVLCFALASVATILVGTRRGLLPLHGLGAELGRRSLDNLQPVNAAQTPAEVHGLVDAINRLLVRVRGDSLRQQAFLADAAHQLRTPLAVLKNEAELALSEAHPSEMHPTLMRLDAGAARASRLATQLLALARSDAAAQGAIALEALDLRDLAADAANEWVPRALEAGVDLGFDLKPATVQGRVFLLRELLANLIHNAIQHAGAGSHVTVRTAQRGVVCVLEVEDDGPGIDPSERAAAFARFTRGAGAAGTGSGLGLAIVRDIASGHGAEVVLESVTGAQGLRVCVSFAPLPQSANG